MSDEEILDAYADGSMSRRAFVRRLVAGGLSLTAAVALAETVSASMAAGAVHPKVEKPVNPEKLDKREDHNDGKVKDEGNEDFS